MCYILDMSKKIKAVLKGIASTMELCPPDPPAIALKDPKERLRRPWERTGQAIQRTLGRFEREQPTQ
jgi:hypothetical protein